MFVPTFVSNLIAHAAVESAKNAVATIPSEIQDKIQSQLQTTVEIYTSKPIASGNDCMQAYFYRVLDKSVTLLIQTTIAVLAAIGQPASIVVTLPDLFLQISEIMVTLPHLLSSLVGTKAVRAQCDSSIRMMYNAYEHHMESSRLMNHLREVSESRDELVAESTDVLLKQVDAFRLEFTEFENQVDPVFVKLQAAVKILGLHSRRSVDMATSRLAPVPPKKSKTGLKHVFDFVRTRMSPEDEDVAVPASAPLPGCLPQVTDMLSEALETYEVGMKRTNDYIKDMIEYNVVSRVSIEAISALGVDIVIGNIRAAVAQAQSIVSGKGSHGLRTSFGRVVEQANLFKNNEIKCKPDDAAILFDRVTGVLPVVSELVQAIGNAETKLTERLSTLDELLSSDTNLDNIHASVEAYGDSIFIFRETIIRHQDELFEINEKLVALADKTRATIRAAEVTKVAATGNPMYRFLAGLLEKLDELRESAYKLAQEFAPALLSEDLEPSFVQENLETSAALSIMFDDSIRAVELGAKAPALQIRPERWDGVCGYAFSRARVTHITVTGHAPLWTANTAIDQSRRYNEVACDGPSIFTPRAESGSLRVVTTADSCDRYTQPSSAVKLALWQESGELTESTADLFRSAGKEGRRLRQTSPDYDQLEMTAEARTAALQCYAYGGFPFDLAVDPASDTDTMLSLENIRVRVGNSVEQLLTLYIFGISRPGVDTAVMPGCSSTEGDPCVWVLGVTASMMNPSTFNKLHEVDQPLFELDQSSQKMSHVVLSVSVPNDRLVMWACAIDKQLKNLAETRGAYVYRRELAEQYVGKMCVSDNDDKVDSFNDVVMWEMKNHPLAREKVSDDDLGF